MIKKIVPAKYFKMVGKRY